MSEYSRRFYGAFNHIVSPLNRPYSEMQKSNISSNVRCSTLLFTYIIRIADSLEQKLSVLWEEESANGVEHNLGGLFGGRLTNDSTILPFILVDDDIIPNCSAFDSIPTKICQSYRSQWITYFYGFGASGMLRSGALSLTRGNPMNYPFGRSLYEEEINTFIRSVSSRIQCNQSFLGSGF